MILPELLNSRGIPFRPHTKANELWVCCPFCKDNKYRLGINYSLNKGACFNGGCGFKSRRVIQTFLKQYNIHVQTVDTDTGEQAKATGPVTLPQDFFPLAAARKEDGFPCWTAVEYLLERHITMEQIRSWRLGLSLSGRYRYRIIIPVYVRKRLAMFLGRDFTGTRSPKYLNSDGERSLVNLKKAREGYSLVLLEGVFKAMAVERLGLNLVPCAMLGHSITEAQVERIKKAGWDSVVIFPDPDRAGLVGSLKVADLLVDHGVKPYFPSQFPKAQADDMPPGKLRSLLQGLTEYNYAYAWRSKIRANSL